MAMQELSDHGCAQCQARIPVAADSPMLSQSVLLLLLLAMAAAAGDGGDVGTASSATVLLDLDLLLRFRDFRLTAVVIVKTAMQRLLLQ